MKLKRKVTSLDGVEEKYHVLYTQEGDEYVLDDLELDASGGSGDGPTAAEFAATKKKLDEFRSNNRTLFSELENIKQRMEEYQGIDPERHKKAIEALDKIESKEEQELIKAGKIDDVIQRRTAAMQTDLRGQVEAAQKATKVEKAVSAELRSQLGTLKIEGAVDAAIDKAGVKPKKNARGDILRRAHDTWKITDDGDMVPTTDGTLENKRYGKDGDALVSMEEWFSSDIIEGAGHLLVPAEGGGAGGGEKGHHKPGKRVVDGSDPVEFGKSLEDIATGKVEVES